MKVLSALVATAMGLNLMALGGCEPGPPKDNSQVKQPPPPPPPGGPAAKT